jgi:anti-sigma regulatory factor (Ser/Thr protein kinase)
MCCTPRVGPASPASAVAERFGVSRQAVQLHLQKLSREGLIEGTGKVRWRQYRLASIASHERRFLLKPGFTEYSAWNELRPRMDLPADEQELFSYGVTEMVNNVIDHSGAKSMRISLERTAASLRISIIDNGVGIFNKIAAALKLTDPREAILDLIKGKFTTDPKHHTGEGIFFTSRAFDRFSISSSNLLFMRSSHGDEWSLTEQNRKVKGTTVTMYLLVPAKRKLIDVFTPYSSGPEDYRFARTRVPVKLATLIEESLMSRSSAKRVLARIDRFDEAIMDFAGIKSIGQAFADEIFRVFPLDHPQVRLIPINANEQVTSMIRRAQAAT